MMIRKQIIIYKNKILQDRRLLFFFCGKLYIISLFEKFYSGMRENIFAMEFYKILLSNFNEIL